MSSLNPIDLGAPLGRKNAAHLLRRATFGPSRADIDTYSAYTIDQALIELLDNQLPVADPPLDALTGETWLPAPTGVNSEESELMDIR